MNQNINSSNNSATIGDRIRLLRENNKYSQEYIAGLLGTNKSTWSRIESNSALPSTKLLIQICKKFKVSSDYVLFGVEGKNLNVIDTTGISPNAAHGFRILLNELTGGSF